MFMPDSLPPNPNHELAPSTQRRLRVLEEVIDITAGLMRMIQQQTQQRCEASQNNGNDVPRPLITENPAEAIEKLAKSIRHTVALAEQLEHPTEAPAAPEPRPQRHINPKNVDVSRMSDAELAEAIAFLERKEPGERERPENYAPKDAEAAEQDPNRAIAERVADICRALGLPQFPKGHPWRQRYLLDLMALEAFADEYRAIAPTVAYHAAAPNNHPPSTAPPDD